MPSKFYFLLLFFCYFSQSTFANDITTPVQKRKSVYPLDTRHASQHVHRGIKIVAYPLPSGKVFDVPALSATKAIKILQQSYDFLLLHSPYAAKQLKIIQENGPIWISYIPAFPPQGVNGGEATTFALFNPSLVRRSDGGKSYPVVISRHTIHWPITEIAWVLAHELIGHGLQHLQNRLDRSRIKDLECEAFLHQEQVLQELGLWKNGEMMVRTRRQMEESWCQPFRLHMARTMPDKMSLWEVRNLDVPQLLTLYKRYMPH